MTMSYVLMQNLRRNPLRTGLTAVAFALPMAIFVGALSFVAALDALGKANARELRLAVHHKRTLTNLLPERKRQEIEGLDPDGQRLTAVCGMRWFGGRVPDTQNTLTSLAADVDTFPRVYSDVGMTEIEIAAWNRDRQACLVGADIADEHGWQVGDRVELTSTVPPYMSLDFHVVKIMAARGKENFFYFRRDYLDESRRSLSLDADRCNIFWVKCTSIEALRALQTEIDALNANTTDETKSEDENAFASQFTQAAGDIPSLMQAMSAVVVFVIALVAGNTMMMSFRERTREFAVFKAMGFSGGRICRIVLSESVLLALAGGVLGVVPTAIVMSLADVQIVPFGPIRRPDVSLFAVLASLSIAALVGVGAGLWPAYRAIRLRPVDALRRLG